MSIKVFFATNRLYSNNDPANASNYSADILPPTDASKVVYAVAEVDGIDTTKENSGRILRIDNVSFGSFSSGVVDAIQTENRDLMVFIHGFANDFDAGTRRAAFNRQWFEEGGESLTMLAFTWPSIGKVLGGQQGYGDGDYLTDQLQASRSGFHISQFFLQLVQILQQIRKPCQHGAQFCSPIAWAITPSKRRYRAILTMDIPRRTRSSNQPSWQLRTSRKTASNFRTMGTLVACRSCLTGSRSITANATLQWLSVLL
jgi:hypothetical protein